MIKLYSADINSVSKSEYSDVSSVLCKRDIEKLQRLSLEKDKHCFLLGRKLLFKGARELFSKEQIDLSFNENGKPYTSDFYFSISHSGDMVYCAFSDNEIGIDIEKKRDIKRRDKYKLFSDNENEFTNNSDDLSSAFLTVWTRKESLVKLNGLTIKDASIDTFSIKDYEFSTQEKDGYIITVCIRAM